MLLVVYEFLGLYASKHHFFASTIRPNVSAVSPSHAEVMICLVQSIHTSVFVTLIRAPMFLFSKLNYAFRQLGLASGD